MQALGEPVGRTPLPGRGSLLELPSGPVETLHLKHVPGGLELRLVNASDVAQTATVGSGLLNITGATRSDLAGTPLGPLEVSAGRVTLELGPRRFGVVHLTVEGTG